MKTIICGSRSLIELGYDNGIINRAVEASGWRITHLIHGDCRGPDRWAEEWAKDNQVPFTRYPANWDAYGKSAGYRRNEIMAKNAEAVLAIYDGSSNGTRHMIELGYKHNLKVFVYDIVEENIMKSVNRK